MNKKLGSRYVVGNFEKRKNLNFQGKGFLLLIVQLTPNSVFISRNEYFYAQPYLNRGLNIGIKNCQHLGVHQLNDNLKQLRNIYPGFCYSILDKWVDRVKPTTLDKWDRKDIKMMNQTEYGFMAMPKSEIIGFQISNPIYKKWFKTSYSIFDEPSVVDIPEPISQCEKLFDKNVLPIKKRVKDLGDLNNITIKETKNVFLYDDSNLITNTFFTELNKKIQCYGYISLLYNNNDERLINSKNRLKFNILKNNEREFITLQLEDVLTPKKIETTDFKIFYISNF